MSYLVLFIIIALLSWLVFTDFSKTGLKKSTLLAYWGIKLAFASVYILVFTFYFGEGQIYGDVHNFLNDSKVINDYAKNDLSGYLKLLFGFQTDEINLMQTHLAETNIWSYGENGDFINDNRLIIRIHSLIHFFSFKNIWIHTVIFAFFSFVGTILTYQAFESHIKHKKLFIMSLFCFPTITFWGSAPAKESLMLLAIGLFVYSVHRLLGQKKLILYLTLSISTLLLLFNKPYVGIIVIPMIVFLVLSYRTGITLRKGIVYSIIIVLIGVASALIPGEFNSVDRITYKQKDLINLGQGGVFFITDSSFCAFDYSTVNNFNYNESKGVIQVEKSTQGEYKLFGESEFYPFSISPSKKEYEVYHIIAPANSSIEVTPIDHSFKQLMLNIPSALFNVLIRPLPSDPGDNLKILGFMENILFLAWLVFVGFNRRKNLSNTERSWVFYLVLISVLSILLIGLTVPILGAIARYKIAPILFLLIASFIYFERKPKAT